jgi:hypothetical protein
MSDGLPAGAQALEPEEGTAIVGPDPTVAQEDAEPAGVVEQNGVKMVPLAALKETRTQLKEQLKAKDTEIGTLKPKAEKYDQVEPQIRAAMPIIEGIQRRPDLVAQLNQPAPAPKVAAGPLSEAEAVDYAKDFDLYKADGSPDIDRAQRIAKRHADMSARSTQAAITPFVQNEAQRQSAANFANVAAYVDPSGNSVDRTILENVWRNIPVEMSAKPEVAGVLYRMALAEQIIQGKAPKPGLAPALITESPGGRALAAPSITQIDTQIMKAAGISDKQYAETAARFKPGQSNFLE